MGLPDAMLILAVAWRQRLIFSRASKNESVLRDEAEGEMRAQLRRQAAAHSDHLADVLSVQVEHLSC